MMSDSYFAEQIVEPRPWEFDGDMTRREPVIDPDDNRVIRFVGWRRCMTCTKQFFSEDCSRIRMCDRCKANKSE